MFMTPDDLVKEKVRCIWTKLSALAKNSASLTVITKACLNTIASTLRMLESTATLIVRIPYTAVQNNNPLHGMLP